MNVKFLGLLLASMCFLQSCKKDKTPEQPAEPLYKLKSVTNEVTGNIWTIEYDAQNRITTEWRGDNQSRKEYTYSAGTVKENEYSSAGVLSASRIHELNSDGLTVKTTNVGFAEYSTRTFNSNKQRQREIEYNASGQPIMITDYYYTGLLLDSITYKNASGIVNTKYAYEYYTDITNTIAYQYRGLHIIFGIQTPMAIKKVNTYFYDYTTGALVSQQDLIYTYERDSQERIIKLLYSGPSSGSNHYTYY